MSFNPLLLLALVPPLLYAVSTYLDQYIVHRYGERGEGFGPLPIVMVSSFISIFVALVIFLCKGGQVLLPLGQELTLIAGGVMTIGAIAFYIYALNEANADVTATVWWQLIPVGSLIASWFILHELPSTLGLISGGIILVGATIMSIDPEVKGYFNGKVILLMLGSVLAWVMMNVLFKAVGTTETSYWVSIFWEHVGIVLFGLCCYAHPRVRAEFNTLFGNGGPVLFGTNIATELITYVGDAILQYSILWGSVALGEVLHSTQIVWAFLVGVLLYKFKPEIFEMEYSRLNILLKVIGLVVILAGLAVLLL